MRQLDAFEIIFAIGLVTAFARRLRERLRNRARVTESRRDGLELLVLLSAFLGMLAIPVVHLTTGTLVFANYRQPTWLGIAGGMVFASALVLLWRSHVDLGRNWSESLELMESHRLVTNGVYRFVRHPMYAAIWLWAVGQALMLHNFIAGPSALALFAPLYFVRVPREERMMLEHFGEEYAAYMVRTRRVLPISRNRQGV
jgi:protein-S-isoprenylcysteine O-methyltransferase Ste14